MNHLKIAALLLTSISFFTSLQEIYAQIPSNDRGAPCVNELLIEDFGSAIPAGWEGDWMLTNPPLMEGWNLISGPSPGVPATGANGAFSGNYYAYMESGGPGPANSVFKINTPAIPLSAANTSIRFRVLMHGASIGSLKVNVLSGPGFANSENVLTLSGAQHPSSDVSNWEEAFIDVRQYDGQTIKVEFEGMKLVSGQGDIAIDLVQVCSEPLVPTMGEWGIMVLALLLMICGVIAYKTRPVESLTC